MKCVSSCEHERLHGNQTRAHRNNKLWQLDRPEPEEAGEAGGGRLYAVCVHFAAAFAAAESFRPFQTVISSVCRRELLLRTRYSVTNMGPRLSVVMTVARRK